MIYTGTNPEDRILYDYEQRKQILKNNYGICACCGKRLTTKTMTVEHIIPLSRGGTNDMANITALCYDCNQEKNNTLFLPSGFYHALVDTPRYREICQHIIKWYRNLEPEDKLDLTKYPLITPRNAIFLEPRQFGSYHKHNKRSQTINRQSILEWQLVGNKNRYEVEAVTDCYIREIRSMAQHEPVWMDAVGGVYVLKKKTTDKLLALAGICYFPEQHGFRIYVGWSILSKNIISGIIECLADMTIHAIEMIAGEEINWFEIQSPIQSVFDSITHGRPLIRNIAKTWGWQQYESPFDNPAIHCERFGIDDIKYKIRKDAQKEP